MICSRYSKYTLLLIGALLTVACQPPAASDSQSAAKNEGITQTAIVIDDDSVTMSQKDILTIKPSRYQPSLGLQGYIKPMQQVRFIAGHEIIIKNLLVSHGQWVEKNDPLLIVLRQTTSNIADDIHENNHSAHLNKMASDNAQTILLETDNKLNNSKLELTKTTTTDMSRLANSKKSIEIDTTFMDADISNDDVSNNNQSSPLITVRAPFSGRINGLYIDELQQVAPHEPLLYLSNDTDLHFIATLPIQAKPQLSIGQTVNFTTDSMIDKFTGQVSNLIKSRETAKLLVYVNVVKNDASRGILQPDMPVTGRVDYGQIEVGTIVPKSAIHDADLTELQKQPYQPLSPLTAQVWIIQQNQRLIRQQVDVISFDPSTGQYLIAGINNDSLICLAPLPISATGKKVIVS